MLNRLLISACVALAASLAIAQVAKIDDPALNLVGYRTVDTAIRAKTIAAAKNRTGRTGYLGVFVNQAKGGLRVEEVEAGGPADKAGIQTGDVLTVVDDKKPKSQAELRDVLQAAEPDQPIAISLLRAGKKKDVQAVLAATSRPMPLAEERPVLGMTLGDVTSEGIPIRRVTEGSPAEKAGLKANDLVTRLEGLALEDPARLDALLNEKRPGDIISIVHSREGKEAEAKATLAEPPPAAQNNQTFSARNVWKKDVYKLAIIGIEYADVKHNDKITTQAWNDQMFSKGTYTTESATGQKVYGSLNDFFQEVSVGALRVEGKMLDWVQLSKNRLDYQEGNGTGNRSRQMLFGETLDKLMERDGANCLEGYDGIFFVFAGARVNTSRGSVYWPHRSNYRHKDKNWPYLIVPEGGARMTDISVLCHEFGHMIGLPDLYARPENPGSEGLGIWCLMSNQAGSGRPQHPSAWCKEQLGWLNPTVIDPTVPQKLILGPTNGSKTECYKVLLRADGSEYLLLENRRKTGFDTSLPAEGMLIWHVLGNRPILEESHGVSGPNGPRVYMSAVPYPSPANNAMTPFTTPSSKSQLGGGLPVYITNIRQLADGRIAFMIGYEFN